MWRALLHRVTHESALQEVSPMAKENGGISETGQDSLNFSSRGLVGVCLWWWQRRRQIREKSIGGWVGRLEALSLRWEGTKRGKWYILKNGCWLIAGSLPWGPPAGGRGTAGWPDPPAGQDCYPPLPPQSSAQWDRRPSGRSPGCRGSGGTLSCQGLGKTSYITSVGFCSFLNQSSQTSQFCVFFRWWQRDKTFSWAILSRRSKVYTDIGAKAQTNPGCFIQYKKFCRWHLTFVYVFSISMHC